MASNNQKVEFRKPFFVFLIDKDILKVQNEKNRETMNIF